MSKLLVVIPTDPNELVVYLDQFAPDWLAALYFINNVALTQDIVIDTESVIRKCKELYGEE